MDDSAVMTCEDPNKTHASDLATSNRCAFDMAAAYFGDREFSLTHEQAEGVVTQWNAAGEPLLFEFYTTWIAELWE